MTTYTAEQQRANRKLWTAWLRANPEKQGEMYLSREGRYCCLGGGCEVAIANGVPVSVNVHDGVRFFDDEIENAPNQFMNWVGLSDPDGQYIDAYGEPQYLTNDNDSGKTFAEIADIIDSEPEGLFVS